MSANLKEWKDGRESYLDITGEYVPSGSWEFVKKVDLPESCPGINYKSMNMRRYDTGIGLRNGSPKFILRISRALTKSKKRWHMKIRCASTFVEYMCDDWCGEARTLKTCKSQADLVEPDQALDALLSKKYSRSGATIVLRQVGDQWEPLFTTFEKYWSGTRAPSGVYLMIKKGLEGELSARIGRSLRGGWVSTGSGLTQVQIADTFIRACEGSNVTVQKGRYPI